MTPDMETTENIPPKSGIPALLKRLTRWDIAVLIILAVLSVYMIDRASDEYRWSDWGFGDAQSMLSLKQWNEEGWYDNFFLFIPQGYAKAIRALDDEPLRHHAHGTCPGSAPGVGPRLWYTHYPAGYLVPYAIMFKIGMDDIFTARTLSIILSIAAVVLMYILFSKIVSRPVAAFTVIFYVFSPVFLGYADTIANQPLDDLLRFGFMLAIVMAGRTAEMKTEKKWLIAAWIMEFALSLSSFDSVFFIYTWLVGWDLIEGKGFRLKRYLIFSLAPISAHGLQFLQNVWYLGFDMALKDVKVAFMQKSGAVATYGGDGGRISSIMSAFYTVFMNVYQPLWAAGLPILFYAVFRIFRSFFGAAAETSMPRLRLIALLFVCGLAYIVVLPHGAKMPYQGRQMLPFVSLLAGGLTWAFISTIVSGMSADAESVRTNLGKRGVVFTWLVLSSIFLVVFWYRFTTQERVPVYGLPDDREMEKVQAQIYTGGMQYVPAPYVLKEEIGFIRQLLMLKTEHDTVYFDLGGFRSFWNANYVPGFPQINPIVEYYASSRPVLCFTNIESVASDIEYLVRKKGPRFSPVIISSDNSAMGAIFDSLGSRGIITRMPDTVHAVMNRFIVDLTPYMNWDLP